MQSIYLERALFVDSFNLIFQHVFGLKLLDLFVWIYHSACSNIFEDEIYYFIVHFLLLLLILLGHEVRFAGNDINPTRRNIVVFQFEAHLIFVGALPQKCVRRSLIFPIYVDRQVIFGRNLNIWRFYYLSNFDLAIGLFLLDVYLLGFAHFLDISVVLGTQDSCVAVQTPKRFVLVHLIFLNRVEAGIKSLARLHHFLAFLRLIILKIRINGGLRSLEFINRGRAKLIKVQFFG